jgi:mannose-6-phosphate isomerase
MTELYPIKFEPVLKEKIWGGTTLVNHYYKKGDPEKKYGESWELSAVSDNLSVISNGFLAGNNIEELIEVYMGDLTGDAVFDKFGNEFPLLIKLIEARQDLSIQVHPDNVLAKKRHNAYGKTEMWYILESEKNARIFTGFKSPSDRETYFRALKTGDVAGLLNVEESFPGDVFFTPSGRIHSIGAGNVLVEIQQTSDITYRLFDWNRKDMNGNPRELHTELAIDAIDFKAAGKNKITREILFNRTNNLISCEFFNTNSITFNERITKDYNLIDSFVIYVCTAGEFLIRWNGDSEPVLKGETVLLPAMIKDIVLEPAPEATLLEVFINQDLN